MRCTGGEDGPPCDRCKHSGYNCIFEESNRGKKAAANAAAAAAAKAEKAALAAQKGDDEVKHAPLGFSNKVKGKNKQSNSDLAKSLEKMEATLNTVLRTIRDPSHANSLGHASGMLTRPHSPVREERRQETVPQVAPTSIAPSQLTGALPPSEMDPTRSHAAKYALMARMAGISGMASSSSSSSNRRGRPPSPRLHSLPPDSLNPLGLLAEASLGNQTTTKRVKSEHKSSNANSPANTADGSSPAKVRTPGSTTQRDGEGKDEAEGSATGREASQPHRPDEAADDSDDTKAKTAPSTPALGVASKTYFRPGPMSMLPLRKVIIDRELPPELLTSGVVSDAEVLDLFSIFFHNCAQHIILLDPEWHTPQFVCGRSPFLFTVILAIASRYYAARPDLHIKCLQQATKEAFRCLEKGFKSVEIVQAFLLLTMWGQPARRFEEDKSWIFAGIAFRVATDLNLHRKSAAGMSGNGNGAAQDPATAERDKEIRNRERTWIFCFVVDRSLSSQLGKPTSIKEDFIIRNTRSWALHRAAQPSDLALAAMTELLRCTSRQMDLLYSSVSSVTGLNPDLDFSAMSKIFHEQMEEWRAYWHARGLVIADCHNRHPHMAPPDETLSAREFEVAQIYCAANSAGGPPPDDADHTMRTLYYLTQQAPLRYHYVSLTVHSFGLQFGSALDRGTYFAKCYDAAKGIFFAARDGMRPVLRYAPDTQLLIISFALVFMLKLTRPTFSKYADSEEIFKLVEEGADLLEEAAASPTHTPALYSHFLRATLAQAQAEQMGRYSGDQTTGFPSRALTPETRPNTSSGKPGGTTNSDDLMNASFSHHPNNESGRMGEGNANSASVAFDLPTDVQMDPTLHRGTRHNSISEAALQSFGISGLGGGGMTMPTFDSPHHAMPNHLSGSGALGSGGNQFSYNDGGNVNSLMQLDNIWWNQLVPAGLGGPLDGLNGGIDMASGFSFTGSHQGGAGTGITRPSSPTSGPHNVASVSNGGVGQGNGHREGSSAHAGGNAGSGGNGLNSFGFDFSHGGTPLP